MRQSAKTRSPTQSFGARYKQELLLALLFTGLLMVWEALTFHVNYVETLTKIVTQTYRVWAPDMIAQLLLIVMSSLMLLFLLLAITLASRSVIRLVGFVVFACAIMYEYGYMATLHRGSAAEDAIMALRFVDANFYYDVFVSCFDPKAILPIVV